MKDLTACDGCGRNAHGEQYCARCEDAIDRAEKEQEELDRLGRMVEDADFTPPPGEMVKEAAISTIPSGDGPKERLQT